MIATFAQFDLSSSFPRTQTLLTLLFVVVIGIVLPVPGMAIVAAALVTSLMLSAPFLGDERGRLDTLYGILPISRSTVMFGRALSIVVYYVAAASLATVITVMMAVVRGNDIPSEMMLIAHACAMAVFGLAMALQLPVFFRVGYSRGRFMSYTPVLVVAGGAWLPQATDLHLPLLETMEGVPLPLIVCLGCGLGLAGVLVGAAASAVFYRTREL